MKKLKKYLTAIYKKKILTPLTNQQNKLLEELTNEELKYLQNLNAINKYITTYEQLQKTNNRFTKNDVLWSLYNDLKLEFENKQDLILLSIVLNRQADILTTEQKYNSAVELYSCSIYLLIYNYNELREINLFKRHFNNKRKRILKNLLNNSNINLNEYQKVFVASILENIPKFYDENKVTNISNRIVNELK